MKWPAKALTRRWRPATLERSGIGNKAVAQLAMICVSATNRMATHTLKHRWYMTTSVALSLIHSCRKGIHRLTKGAAIAMPMILNTRFPNGTWRVWMLVPSVVSTPSRPLPRLAPSTSPSATSSGITPVLASVAVSSTVARLE